MSNSQTRGVVLLESEAYQRLLDSSSRQDPPKAGIETRHVETQTTLSETQILQAMDNADDEVPTKTSPMDVQDSAGDEDPIQKALDGISKYYRPACLKIIQLLPCIDPLEGTVIWAGTPLHGLPLQQLLVSTCVPFKPRPDEKIIEFLRQQGVTKFRNHLLNENSYRKRPFFPASWETPYIF